MPLTTHGNRRTTSHLAAELAGVEGRFAAAVASDLPCVNNLMAHLERYRGKMLRPRLVLVSGMAAAVPEGELLDAHRILATVVEMVHVGTLVHDDILDDAEMRRQGPTISRLSGSEIAVMLGDYLFSHAYHLCASLGDPRMNRVLTEATNTVCAGELLQLANRNNWALDERTYFEIIQRKTASLCGACCRLGALVSDPPDSPEAADATADRLFEYGEKLGMAFQIIDDLLDLVGDPARVGKTLGRDIEKGKLTLPLIHCLRVAEAEPKRRLMALLTDPNPSHNGQSSEGGRVAAARDLIAATGSAGYAQNWAARLAGEAKDAISNLPPSEARSLLVETADAVISRQS